MTISEVTLGSLEKNKGDFVDGPFGSNLKSSEYVELGVPIIQLKNIRPNEYLPKDIKFISLEKASELRRHAYKAGDVCIAKLGAVGTACIIPEDAEDGIIVADVVRFRGDKSKIEYKYLCHFLNSVTGQARVLQLSRGSTRTRTNLTDLKQVKIPLPNLQIQKYIAEILDRAEALKQKRQQALKLADEFLRATFLNLFGINSGKDIELKPITEVFDIKTGKLNSNAAVEGGKYPFFTCAKELSYIDNFAFDQEALLLAGNNASADYDVKHYNGKFNAYQRTYVLTLKELGNSYEFFRFALELQLQSLKKDSKGSNTKYITLEIMARTLLPVPSFAEQKTFGDIAKKVEALKAKMQTSETEIEHLAKSLSQKAFRGELTSSIKEL